MKIMIVEDDSSIRELVGERIERWGYDVVAPIEFERILEVFLEEKPHLVLLDIQLPRFDGFHWCERIREVSQVPILFLSSRRSPVDTVMAMNMGGDDLVQKPFHSDVLIAKVKALLRRTYSYAEAAADVIEHRGVVLHLNERELAADGIRLSLTRTEFVILSALMRQRGALVPRRKLMRQLWEDENFVDDNTLTVNVARLRKKLAELGREDFISTRKGEGYLIP